MSATELWPRYSDPGDLAAVEAVALSDRRVPESTYEVLRRAATMWPDRDATVVLPDAARWQQPVRRSYAQLLGDVHRTANLLHELSIGRRDPVAVISPNCDELITAVLAAQLAGVAAPVNGALSQDHTAELVRRSGARVLVAAAPELDNTSWDAARALVQAGLIDTVALLAPTGGRKDAPPPNLRGARVGYLGQWAAGHDDTGFAGPRPVGSDIAALFHTGGTTGAPKLAAHTHTNQTCNGWMIAANNVAGETPVMFGALPLFHVNALMVTVVAAMLRGQTVVWAGPLGYRDPDLYANFWKIVQHYGIGLMSAVPTVYSVLAGVPVDADVTSLRRAIVGASPLPPAVRSEFESRTGVRLVQGYGLTEATCATSASFLDHPHPNSVGQRLPYQQVKAVHIDAAGDWRDALDGEIGTLVIKGPNVFSGYVSGRSSDGFVLDANVKLRDGWLDTGDLGHVDADGFIHLNGRAKDLIIRGGHNIDPAVVEDALLAHPDVTGAAAVGRPDVHAGEVPVAYVTLALGSSPTEGELLSWAADHVSERAAAPKEVTVVDVLPLTAVGKPNKLPLRAAATQSAVEDALAGLTGVGSITVGYDDGSLVTSVAVDSCADNAAVARALGHFAIEWRISES